MSKTLGILRQNPKPDAIIGKFPGFHLEYHRNHVVGSNLRHIMYGGLMNMRLAPIKARWEARDTNSLWWWVRSLNHFERECIKRHQMRRVRHAFRGALQTLGYDSEGNPTAVGLHEARRVAPLRGSVQFRVKKDAVNVSFADLQADMVKGIQQVIACEKKMGPEKQKRPSSPPLQTGRKLDNMPAIRTRLSKPKSNHPNADCIP